MEGGAGVAFGADAGSGASSPGVAFGADARSRSGSGGAGALPPTHAEHSATPTPGAPQSYFVTFYDAYTDKDQGCE
jgi:hypothetical protein